MRLGSAAELDEKDRKIIEMLVRNARVAYSEIARAVGLSDVAVIKKVRRLERLGVIKRYTVVLDPGKLGYRSVSVTGIDVEPDRLFDVLSHLREKEYVRFLAITSGDHSLLATIWASDGDELARIHDEISKLPGVKRVCPAILLEVIKE